MPPHAHSAHANRHGWTRPGSISRDLPLSWGGVHLGHCLLVASALAVAAYTANAAPPAALRVNGYSNYERDAIDDALKYLGAVEDRAPEGKLLEGIDIITLEVFERRDLVLPDALTFFNVFHTTTKRYVIEREVLLHEGQAYRQALVDDSIRNLRQLVQLSLVLTVATQGEAPNHVRLVVITKDVWSLRPNWNLQYTSGGLQLLSAQPAEMNIAGTHQILNTNFELRPSSLALGAGYANRRIQGRRLAIQGGSNLIFNRQSGDTEGSFGSIIVGQPLFSPLDKWAWDGQAAWLDAVLRRYVNAELSRYNDPSTGKRIPFAFRTVQFNTQYSLTRSFGWTTKHDISVGVSASRSGYPTSPAELYQALPPGTYDAQTARDFIQREVPISDNRVGPFIQYHTYSKRYVRVIDFDTLGLQEDFRLGHNVFFNVYPVVKALKSTRDFVGFDVAAQYTARMGDGLARLAVEFISEVQTGSQCPSRANGAVSATGPVCDSSIDPALHLVSPTAGFGRFVFDAHLLYRFSNYLNQIEFLGGDTRLRGYPANYFTGANILNSNLEFRTRSVDILTAQAGLVAFYDIGAAFNTWAVNALSGCSAVGTATLASLPTGFCPVQAAGTGLRILFPQLDRIAFRADIGFPLGEGRNLPGVTPMSFFISLGQAFMTPVVGPGVGTGSTVSVPGLSGSPTTNFAPPP